MLQASEYHAGEYLAWYSNVKDFSSVEKRKHLVKTPKAVLLLTLAGALAIIFIAIGISMFWFLPVPGSLILCAVIILATPYLVAYGITLPVIAAEVIVQKPLIFFELWRTRKTLERYKAIKIGVAGSFGKTSMREILKTVLAAGKKIAAPAENHNTPLGIAAFVKKLKGDEEILIFELGEYYPGDVRKLCSAIRPDWGFVTGVNEAHLEKFKTLDRTAKTVFEIREFLSEEQLYINGESAFAKKYTAPRNLLYGRGGVDGWRIEGARTGLDGTAFMLMRQDLRIEAHSKLLGLHNIGPLAAAADIALKLGLSPAQIEAGIKMTGPFDHRLEPRTDAYGVVTLDDSYNGNPDGVRAVIDFLASLTDHRRFYVTPGLVEMGSRTETVHREIGRWLAAAEIEKTILIKDSVTPYIEAGLKEGNYKGEIIWFDDALAAFAALPHMTAKGDVVLLQNDWPDQYR
jgi:UDP-N-acetylmuramoyl-tripeptide--D-alanyl-D-alanine ligase